MKFFSAFILVLMVFPAFAEAPTLATSIPTLLLSLIAMLALIFVLATLVKKTNLGQMKSGAMRVVSVLPLTAREKVILIEVGDKQMLLGVSAQSVNLLKELDEKVTVPETDFRQTMSQFLSKGNKA
ncbi:flagellar biosynthetic protein FliO [Catenovulum maritimum]|nr:flagellar biosynthetic protein FliO [Catenovulum maritimum]